MSYSSFFASGLMAPPMHSTYPAHGQPCTPTTPTHSDLDLSDDDRGMDTTPVAAGNAAPTPVSPSPAPRLRRRRSSLTLSVSPMNAVKSPVRSAGLAWQRQSIGSGARSRSGSLDQATEANSLMDMVARRRSGSIGTALKRNARRVPAMQPPPSQPLPALPSLPMGGMNLLSSRPPLVTRTSSTQSAPLPQMHVKGIPSSPLQPEQYHPRNRDRSYSITSTASSCEPIHEDVKEN
ncbi:hypothetical protein BD626DRAFT_540159 [Schizophyllum amplum]|uniref:Uncharacterized protein n=1 Tax=Schizophyllum amplum TaxID=97359 RepID=A0A550C096_9AGAR|nr:hypothetical protein BD626DRAFT_540159 [Auriculariopsis ampla]